MEFSELNEPDSNEGDGQKIKEVGVVIYFRGPKTTSTNMAQRGQAPVVAELRAGIGPIRCLKPVPIPSPLFEAGLEDDF